MSNFAQMAQPAVPPPWFELALQQALAPIRHDIKKLERRAAIAWNQNETGLFEVVYFPGNLENPTQPPHNLPPIVSREAISDLTVEQKVRYCAGYYPDQPVHVDNLDKSIYLAIGVQLPIHLAD